MDRRRRTRIEPQMNTDEHRLSRLCSYLCLSVFICGFSPRWLCAAAEQAPTARPAPVGDGRLPVRRIVEPNGLKLLVKQNASSEIVAIQCLVRAGVAEEQESSAGIAALTAETCLRGTKGHPGALMNQAVAAAGGGLSLVSRPDYAEFSLVTARDRFMPALKLMAEIVGEPALAAEGLESARAALKQRLDALDDDFDTASYQTLLGELYRSGPYGRPVFGYPSTLAGITLRDVQRFHQRYYVPSNITVAVVGDIDPPTATEAARKAFGALEFRPRPAVAAPGPESITQPRVQLVQKAGANAQVMVGYLVPRTTPQNYPVYRILNAIVGEGKRSRLFQELREKHNFGYDLGSFYQPLLYQSHLVGFVVTAPFRANPRTGAPEPTVDTARARLLQQFQTLAEEGPTDAEITRAKNFLIGRHALEHERNSGQAHWLAWSELMGLGYQFDQEFAARISAITKEQVQQASKDTFRQHALVVTLPKDPT
jgi:zinc protease